ncbi:MAG: hypothetical protein LBI63_05305 [Candidatus Ancillula sp.]|nr:hypothetical protein [Candidatus Ancillula sp.]
MMSALLLGTGIAIASASTYPDIRVGDYQDALHIKTSGRLAATSVGIGYVGHGWKSSCAATAGDVLQMPGQTFKTGWWLKSVDKKTGVKGYSSVTYMVPAGTDQVLVPNGYGLVPSDTCPADFPPKG